MKKLNAKGFSAVEVLVVIVIVGLIGAVGWLVYDRQQSKNTNTQESAEMTQLDSSQEPKSEETVTQKDDEQTTVPAGYRQYKGSKGDFTFNVSEDWFEVKSSMNDETTAYVSPSKSDFPNIYVWTTTPDNSSCDQTSQNTKKVTVDGIEAEQFTRTTSAKTITTCVKSGGKVYHITHGYTTKSYVDQYNEAIRSFNFL